MAHSLLIIPTGNYILLIVDHRFGRGIFHHSKKRPKLLLVSFRLTATILIHRGKMLIANYIKSAWRNILRHKLFSIINILGLAIGLAAVILIALYVRYETSYDSFWKNPDNIYQLNTKLNIPGQDSAIMSWSSYPTIQVMKQEFSEIDKAGTFAYMSGTIKILNENFYENINFADPGVFEIFDLKIQQGNIESAMKNPADMVISHTFAEKYFPNKSAIGETLSISLMGIDQDYTIKAVFEDLPKNTTMQMNAFCTNGCSKMEPLSIIHPNKCAKLLHVKRWIFDR